MARSDTAVVTDVRITLPDDWWMVPLQPTQARERSVQRLVERQFAGIDHQPQLREQVRKEVLAQADAAAVSDARILALSMQRVDGLPVPASLVVHWIDIPTGSNGADGSLLAALQDEFTPGPTSPAGVALDLAQMPAGTVLRRVLEAPAQFGGADPLPALVSDYWLERPDGAGLVQLAFSTPMVAFRGQMLELFDAIAGALRWVTDGES
ncbi:MAG: hypothetical protein M3257_00070 [Actinomycetota bacterium]|nr:hypothetical protein [Actinomycetota bacterium]